MNTDLLVQQSTIFYLLREGMWKSAQTMCHQVCQAFKKYNDPFFQFWKAFTYFKEGSTNEAINELIIIQGKKDFQFATSAAMIYYQQSQRTSDRDSIDPYRQMQAEGKKQPNDRAFQTAAYFYLFVEETKKAKDAIDLMQQNTTNALLTRGWFEILQPEEKNVNTILENFQKIGSRNYLYIYDLLDEFSAQKSLDFLLGLSKASEWAKKFQITLDAINEIIVVFPTFPYGETEKSKVLMMIGDWDQSQETATKILQIDSNNIFALKGVAFYKLARQGNQLEACEKLEELAQAVELSESKNYQLWYHLSQLYSRVAAKYSGRNPKILSLTSSYLLKARKLQPLNAELCLELAYQTLMLDDYDKAYSLFQEAAALDEGKVESLSGMIQCKIQQGIIDDAEKQLEFVSEIQISIGRTPEIAFLEALLESKKNDPNNQENVQKLIDEALKLQNFVEYFILNRHIAMTKLLAPGYNFYIKLNPDFLVTIAQLYLRNLSTNTMLSGKEPLQSSIGKGTKLLETVTKQIPGLTNAHLLLATGKMALGDAFEAMKAINTVLDQDNMNEDAYILHALISLKTGQPHSASNSLNQAISNNFMIRENALFMLVKGEVEFRTEDFKNSLATMEAAYEIPGVKDKIGPNIKIQAQKKSKILQFTEKDRCQIFVLYAKNLAKNKDEKKAKLVMQKAIQEFVGTTEEGNVMLANSEIAIESGDVKKAINILKAVQPKQATFQQARIILSDIYLKHLKDRRNYTRCYTDLIDFDPSFDNFMLLGNAFMKINEPEEAVRAYEKALNLKPDDDTVIKLIGQAMSLTYDYQKAIEYYEQALRRNEKRNDLIVDLGRLYLRINHLEKAEQLLTWEKFQTDDFSAPNTEMLKNNSQGFLLIAKLLSKKQMKMITQAQGIENQKQQQALLADAQKLSEKIRQAYESSIQSQKEAIERAKMEGGNVEKERQTLGQVYIEKAKYYSNMEKNFKNAYESLEDASKLIPTSEKILQLQAETLYQLNDKIACEQKLKILQKIKFQINPKNDYASMMLSELILQKDESERAIQQFIQHLKEKPDSYGTLTKVIDWFRRQNRLDETKQQIDLAASKTPNPKEPGLCYCRGLYFKYKLQPQQALAEFNIAKRNPQYAEDSLTHMIDIYLSPDMDLYYTLVEDQAKSIDPENLKACDTLLKELATTGSQQRYKQISQFLSRYMIMQSYVLMLSPDPKASEVAIQLLTQQLKQNPECLPAMHALAVAKFIGKKQTEAKNLLKILWKKTSPSSGWEQEELERAWLLYADSFIAIQKYDQAEEVLKKCLKQNKSCGKAEEYMGLIKEKEQSYVDAANHYETAFKLLNKKNPNMGFRLAFNYLKARRYVDCLNISKLILQINPNYPKIQKEIIEKAIQGLRP